MNNKKNYIYIFLIASLVFINLLSSCVSDSKLPPEPVSTASKKKNTPLNLIPGNNVYVTSFGGLSVRGQNIVTGYTAQSGRCDTSSGKYAMSTIYSTTLSGGTVDLAGLNIIFATKPTVSKKYTFVPGDKNLNDTSAYATVTFKVSNKAWRAKGGHVEITVSAVGIPSAKFTSIAIENMYNFSDTTLTSMDATMSCQ